MSMEGYNGNLLTRRLIGSTLTKDKKWWRIVDAFKSKNDPISTWKYVWSILLNIYEDLILFFPYLIIIIHLFISAGIWIDFEKSLIDIDNYDKDLLGPSQNC